MTVNNWQSEAAKLSDAIHDPNSDSQKPIIVLGSPKDLRSVLTKPTTTPPNIMQTLSPRVRRLAMQMQARNGGMPGMPGMPPGMPGMPPGMPGMPSSENSKRAEAMKGLIGALLASKMGGGAPGMPPSMPSGMPGMPPGMLGSGGMPPTGIPGMFGMSKSLKKGKTMNHGKGKFCPDCGEKVANCNCDENKSTGRGNNMSKRGSINKGMLDSIGAFISHLIHNTPYGESGAMAGARSGATGQDGSLGRGGQNTAAQRRLRSNNENDSPTFAQMRDRNATNKDRFEGMKTRGQNSGSGVGFMSPYARNISDPENPNKTRGSNKTQEDKLKAANYNLKTTNAKDLREMMMAGANGDYARRGNTANAREESQMLRANPSGKNYGAKEYNSMSGKDRLEALRQSDNGNNTFNRHPQIAKPKSMSTSKRMTNMSKSITALDKHGTRHVIGGYSLSKRARPASSSNTTRNKYGY